MLSPKVKHFVFETDSEMPATFLPGQFISVHFPVNDKTLKRSYSIANEPNVDHRIEFAASYVAEGPGTLYLYGLKPGDVVQATGPFGRLILKEALPRRYLLLGTSTGITPYRAMLGKLTEQLKADKTLQVVILQGVQRPIEGLYVADFLAFASEFPNQVFFRTYYSQDKGQALLAHEKMGYIQQAFDDLKLNPENDRVYLCGNPNMIDNSFNLLKETGFDVSAIIREKYYSNPSR